MGTQYQGMGRDMLQLDVFKRSILKSNEVLKPHGIDIYNLIKNGDEATFENTLNSFVAIATIQVMR